MSKVLELIFKDGAESDSELLSIKFAGRVLCRSDKHFA